MTWKNHYIVKRAEKKNKRNKTWFSQNFLFQRLRNNTLMFFQTFFDSFLTEWGALVCFFFYVSSLLLISFDISQLEELSWKTISKPLTGLILKKISRKMETLFTADTFLVNTFLQSRWCPLYGVLTVILTKAECKITEWIIKV